MVMKPADISGEMGGRCWVIPYLGAPPESRVPKVSFPWFWRPEITAGSQ
jgi:hypothetical protein